MGIKKYIGSREFYKMTLVVVLPVMLQNFITNFVNMLDNLMVGTLGTEPMSGVSIVNQIIFIFNLAIFGGLGGVGIFTAQFYGKKDEEGIRHTLRYKLLLSVLLSAAALIILLLFDSQLISFFLHETEAEDNIELTLACARCYLKVMLWGLLPFAVTNVFSSTLRETGDTLTPMLAGISAVVTNCLFNFLLIFGKLGFPRLEVEGAAIATVLSRFVECFILIIYAFSHRHRFPYIKGAFKSFYIPGETFMLITRKGMPLLINEILWSGSMATLSVAFSMHGLTVVAAYSISSTVTNLFHIAFISMGTGIGIISGKLLGASQHEEAVDAVRKLTVFSVFITALVGVVMFVIGGEIPRLYNTGDAEKALASYFIRTCAFTAPMCAFANSCYFALRSGGKTVITFLFDCGSMWLLSVPLAFILYFAGLDIHIVFPIVQCIEFIKDIIGYILVKKRVWVKTII